MGRVWFTEGRLLVQGFENQLYWDNLGSSQWEERGGLSRTVMDSGAVSEEGLWKQRKRWSLEGGCGGG